MGSYDVFYKAICQCRWIHGAFAGHEVSHFGQSVDNYPQRVASVATWESGDEVHGYGVPWPVWGFDGFQESKRRMSDWLDWSAGVTVVDVSVDIFSLLWPVKVSANKFQGSCAARVSRGLRVMVVS